MFSARNSQLVCMDSTRTPWGLFACESGTSLSGAPIDVKERRCEIHWRSARNKTPLPWGCCSYGTMCAGRLHVQERIRRCMGALHETEQLSLLQGRPSVPRSGTHEVHRLAVPKVQHSLLQERCWSGNMFMRGAACFFLYQWCSWVLTGGIMRCMHQVVSFHQGLRHVSDIGGTRSVEVAWSPPHSGHF